MTEITELPAEQRRGLARARVRLHDLVNTTDHAAHTKALLTEYDSRLMADIKCSGCLGSGWSSSHSVHCHCATVNAALVKLAMKRYDYHHPLRLANKECRTCHGNGFVRYRLCDCVYWRANIGLLGATGLLVQTNCRSIGYRHFVEILDLDPILYPTPQHIVELPI